MSAKVIVDGSPDESRQLRTLLAPVDVVHVEAAEAVDYVGYPVRDPAQAVVASRMLLDRGPSLIAITLQDQRTVLAWDSGEVTLPPEPALSVERIGAGSAFVAAFAGVGSVDRV